ncbi:addiction module antidote protein [Endozoicomonas sp. ISHI1]|uniref:addiction module antidote protein n=1 Tax=Endozoicomonas sp. ISHI1 TaxID=2825882 RepID=UPI0021473B92|nr:addiction module antidote protein [Endozoicomonas sp. ISHI1]
MKKVELYDYDPADDLTTPEAVEYFMAEAFKTNDAAYIAHAFGVAARARGMTAIAEQTGLSREQLCKSFSEQGNPTLKTIIALTQALGLTLTPKAT